MTNPYGITLDDASLRWAAAEGVSESVIAAVCLLGEKSVAEIVAKLSPAELGQVVNIIGRSPNCYPPGVYAALKDKRDLASPPPRAHSPPSKEALEKDARRQPKGATNEHARPPQKASTPRHYAADGKTGQAPRIVVGEEVRRQPPPRLVLEIDVGERVFLTTQQFLCGLNTCKRR